MVGLLSSKKIDNREYILFVPSANEFFPMQSPCGVKLSLTPFSATGPTCPQVHDWSSPTQQRLEGIIFWNLGIFA